MSYPRLLCALIACGLIAGCGNDSNHLSIISDNTTSIADGGIVLEDGAVSLHRDNAPDATITAAGDLQINGSAVTVDPAQREQLQHYYQGVLAVREHGIATGKAGMAIAGAALKGVAASVTSGDTDQIGKQVDAKSQKVGQEAAKICLDLAAIKTAQDNLATQLPAFKPYAGIVGTGDIHNCHKDDEG